MPKISELALVTSFTAAAYLIGIQDNEAKRFSVSDFIASRWHSGVLVPDVNTGNVGDYYLNTVNGDVYSKVSGTWELLCTIKGTDGIDGVDGTNGIGVPAGGTSGQVLQKNSSADGDTVWADAAAGGGVSMGKVLALS